jgi:hypothetical protein
MGAAAPQLGGIEKHHTSHPEYVDFQNFGKRQKISNENMRR